MSLGYSLVKLFLKVKGEKKSWSQDPIDYLKKRKQDIHTPKKHHVLGSTLESKEIQGVKVTAVLPKAKTTGFLLMYCHGGAFVYGPTKENWSFLARLAKHTSSDAWMIDYPKAPEKTIETITESVYSAYMTATKTYDPSKIVLLGDSAGGSLILTLAQRLVRENKPLPNRLIPITPVVDASVSNPKIPGIDEIDPILSVNGVKSANTMCVGELSLKDPLISPLYGVLKDLPPVHLFMATDDILTPDQELLAQQIKEVNGSIEVIVGENMPHVWPILPFMPEAKEGLMEIVSIVNMAVKEDGE